MGSLAYDKPLASGVGAKAVEGVDEAIEGDVGSGYWDNTIVSFRNSLGSSLGLGPGNIHSLPREVHFEQRGY